MSYVKRAVHSATFYPISILWLAGMAIAAFVAGGWLRFDVGLILFAVAAIMLVLVSTHRELGTVHVLVDGQHHALVELVERMGDRINQLVDALKAAGVQVPHDDAGVDRERTG